MSVLRSLLLLITSMLGFVAVADEPLQLNYLSSVAHVSLEPRGFDRIAGIDREVRLIEPISASMRDDVIIISSAGSNEVSRHALGRKGFDGVIRFGDQVGYGLPGALFQYPDQSFLLADRINAELLHLDPDGGLLYRYPVANVLSRPVAVTVNSANADVIVADQYLNRLLFIRHQGDPYFASPRLDMRQYGFVVDMAQHDNTLLVLTTKRHILSYDMQGNLIGETVASEIEYPAAMTVAQDGRIFIIDQWDNSIKVYRDGALLGVFGETGDKPGQFNQASDITVYQDRLLVSDTMNNRVQIFSLGSGENTGGRNGG